MSPEGPTRRFEGLWKRRGCDRIAGLDEAGRGCLAGPVFAGAVVLGRSIPRGIDDSKRLSRAERERLFAALSDSDARIGWGEASPEEIDRLNIRQASFLAMRRALEALGEPPDALLVDGFELPGVALPQRALIHGDRLSVSIAAASIIAKVLRDHALEALAAECPGYGFERHVGYPTPEHLAALARLGPTRYHRRSFAPVRAVLARQLSIEGIPLD